MTCFNVPVLAWPCKPRPPIQARIAKEEARPVLSFSMLWSLLPWELSAWAESQDLFFSFEFSWRTLLIEVTLLPQWTVVVINAPKADIWVVQCSWSTLSWMHWALQCTHLLFCLVYGTQKDMIAQQRWDTALTTALRQDESWTLIHTNVLWTPLYMTCLCSAHRLILWRGTIGKGVLYLFKN